MEKSLLHPVKSDHLYRMKWESEFERTGFSDLLDFGTADMDFQSPQPILDDLAQVIRRGHLGYPMLPEAYYGAIHSWLKQKNGWDVDTHICLEHNVGIYMAVFNALESLTKAGDRITILTPVHFCFKRMIQINDRIALECPLEEQGGIFRINFDSLESCLKSDTKVLWICNPHNPVGRAWNKEELTKIAELCEKYDVMIFSDDVYCDLIYPGEKYIPIASLSKEISQRTITFYSPSKSYNVTGLRHSFTITENPEYLKRYRESMDKIDLSYGMSLMGIAATIAAYERCDDWIKELMQLVSQNHQTLSSACAQNMPGAKVAKADSTYFAWIDMRALDLPPDRLGYQLEQEEHLILGNGMQLGKGGNGYVRMNLATTEETVQKGIERLTHFWDVHSK